MYWQQVIIPNLKCISKINKVERFVDRKMDKAEELLKKKEKKAKRWYHDFVADDEYRATETHVFLASFVVGLAVGLLCGK